MYNVMTENIFHLDEMILGYTVNKLPNATDTADYFNILY